MKNFNRRLTYSAYNDKEKVLDIDHEMCFGDLRRLTHKYTHIKIKLFRRSKKFEEIVNKIHPITIDDDFLQFETLGYKKDLMFLTLLRPLCERYCIGDSENHIGDCEKILKSFEENVSEYEDPMSQYCDLVEKCHIPLMAGGFGYYKSHYLGATKDLQIKTLEDFKSYVPGQVSWVNKFFTTKL